MNIEKEVKKILLDNRREDSGYQYTVPSSEHYPYQWLWDSCFHAIILAQYEPEAAKREILSLFARQFEDGMVPHIIYWKPGVLHLFNWGAKQTSSITQPPMIAYAVWEIHRRARDRAFLEAVYPKLLAYYRYLIEQRDPRDNHLVGIINPDESGEDNCPRFDKPLGASIHISYQDHEALRRKLVDERTKQDLDPDLNLREHFWVKDVPFNAILVENLRALAHIASLLEHSDGEHYANLNADLITRSMRERCFEDGVFWSCTGLEYEKLKVVTWAHFAPLFAGLYSPEEAAALVRTHLLNPETFWAPYGVRTVSKQEPAYMAKSYDEGFSWRGPVWMAPHWFVYHGLRRYGYETEAAQIREKSEALLQKSGFRECFNPETGDGYGATKFTWGALVLDMKQRQ
jgi:glycogen debranching enzyme